MKLHFTKTTDKFTVRLNVEADCMKLFMDVEPVGAQVVTRDELLDAIKESVDTAKVDLRVVDDILTYLQKGEVVEDRRIIKGAPPQDGADGKLVLLKKKFDGDVEVAIDQRGYADFKELHLYDNIAKGDIIGRLYPPQTGADGVNVFGQPVPAKVGKPIKVQVDRTITIAPSTDPKHDCQVLVAEEEGFLSEEAGRLSIKGELVISGDMDLHYGNVDFIGNLRVTGDVTPGLTLKAKKGITIRGSLANASLFSSAGDISVTGFYYGGPESKVQCAKNFSATVLNGVNAEAGGDIIVSKEALDCSLRTHSSVLMLKGRLIGGEVSVSRGVEAKYIGNEACQRTVIRLCSDVEITDEFAKLQHTIESHEKAIKLLEHMLGPYAQDRQKIERLKKRDRLKLKDFVEKLTLVEGSKQQLSEQKSRMLENAKVNDVMRVNFLSKMYRGVVVIAGDSVYEPQEDVDGPKSLDYIAAKKTFELGELKPLEG